MDNISVLLTIEAVDRASGILGKFEAILAGLNTKLKAVADRAAMSAEELQAVQDRVAASTMAYDRALESQANAQAVLRTSTEDLARVQQEYQVQAARAAEASRVAAEATGSEAAAAREAAAVQAESAQLAADSVDRAIGRQIAAMDALRTAETETARRSRELATAQSEAAAGTITGAQAFKGVAIAGAAAGLVVGAVGVHAVKAAADFQTAMIRMQTSAGESADKLGVVSAGVLKVSSDTATSTDELTKGLYMIESAGFHAKDAITVLRAASEGARAEGASLQEVGNALTSAMNSYGAKAYEATSYTDQMVAAVGRGKMRMQDFAVSLSAVLPVAASAQVKFDQVAGAVATMTAQGMSAQQATQNLSHLIQKLISPTAESIKYMAQLGLNSQDLSDKLGQRGLTGTLQLVFNAIQQHMGPSGKVVVDAFNKSQAAAQDLKEMLNHMTPAAKQLAEGFMNGSVSAGNFIKDMKALSGAGYVQAKQFQALYANADGFNQMLKTGNPAALTFTAALKKVLGDSTSLNASLLLGGTHMDIFKKNVVAVAEAAKSAGTHVTGWSEIQGTFNFKMAQLKDTLKAVEISIGTALLPIVTKMAQAIISVVKPAADWAMEHRKMVSVIMMLIGGLGTFVATLYAVVKSIEMVKTAFTALKVIMMENPWIAVATAVLAATMLIITHWNQVKAVLGEVWSWIKTAASSVAGFFVKVWQDVVKIFEGIWSAIGGVVKKWWPLILAPITGGMSLIVGVIIKYHSDIARAFSAIWEALVGVWNATGGKLIGLIEHAWSVVSQSVSQEWNRIVSTLSQIWDEIVQLWNLTGGKLVNFISKHWAFIKSITEGQWNLIVTVVKQVWDYIYSYISGVLKTILDVLNVVWQAVYGVFKVTWDLIIGVIKAAWEIIWGVIKAAVDVVWHVIIKPAFDTILLFFESTWDAIKGVINTVLDAIKGILRVFIDIFSGNWSRAWHDILNTVNTINQDIWQTISSVFGNIWRWLKSVMGDIKDGILTAWSAIWGGIKGFTKAIWDGITSAFHAGLSALGSIWNGLKKLAADPVNFVIETIYDNGIRTLWNDVSGLFGGPQAPYIGPVRFAKGGPVPGFGTGDTVPALLTPGEFVLSLDMIKRAGGPAAVASMFGGGSNDGYHFGGGGLIGIIKGVGSSVWHGITSGLDALKNVALGGVRSAAEGIFKVLNGLLGGIPGAGTGIGESLISGVHKIEDQLLSFFGGKDKTAVSAPGKVSGTLIQWLTEAMKDTGVPSSWLTGLEIIAMHESGGNPNAQNNWDSNAAAGDPSRGLMQTIMSTFRAYHQAGTSDNIFDPVANAAAAINYIKARYGDINNVPGIRSMARGGPYVGYANGTWDTGAFPHMALLHPHEAVLPASVAAGSRLGGSQTVVFDFRQSQIVSDREIDKMILRIEQQFVQKILPQAGVQILK